MKMKATIGEYSSLDIPITLISITNINKDYSVFDDTDSLNIQYLSFLIRPKSNMRIVISKYKYKIE